MDQKELENYLSSAQKSISENLTKTQGEVKRQIEELKKIKSQVILTTHNVSVMSNDILRPDCYFVMSKTEVSPLYLKTSKELREAHNLGKMYKAGSFNG